MVFPVGENTSAQIISCCERATVESVLKSLVSVLCEAGIVMIGTFRTDIKLHLLWQINLRILYLLPTLAVEMIPSCLLIPVFTVKCPPGSPSTILNFAFQAGVCGSSPSCTDILTIWVSTLFSATVASYWDNAKDVLKVWEEKTNREKNYIKGCWCSSLAVRIIILPKKPFLSKLLLSVNLFILVLDASSLHG